MCLNIEGSSNHLFLHCPVTSQLVLIFQPIQYCMFIIPNSVKELLSSWDVGVVKKPFEKYLEYNSCLYLLGGVRKGMQDVSKGK